MICDLFTRRRRLCCDAADGTTTQKKTLYFSDDETEYLPKPPPATPTRARRHPDRSGRRRSANADILESVGLPSTVSYQDMRTLQEGLRVDDILGCRPTCRGCLREATSMLRGSAARVVRRTSQSLASTGRWTKLGAPPPVHRKLQKNPRPQSKQGHAQGHEDMEASSQPQVPDSNSDSLPQLEDSMRALPPGQWLRQRFAYSDAPVGK